MKSKTAPMSLSIRIITTIMILMLTGFFIASCFDIRFLIPALILFLTCLLCWIYAPKSYEIVENDLIIHLNAGKKVFKSLKKCSLLEQPLPFIGIRLWGNGGLFGGTGIFWNRKYGIFRAYVTSARHDDMLLIETEKHKIIISPQDKHIFLED